MFQPQQKFDLNMFSQAIHPLVTKLQSLEEKVDRLSQDKVTRADIEKLRDELVGTFVPKDSYEARHAVLIERDNQIELQLKELKGEYINTTRELSSTQQQLAKELSLRTDALYSRIQAELNDHKNSELTEKDRRWVWLSQIFGFISILISALAWILQHIKVQ